MRGARRTPTFRLRIVAGAIAVAGLFLPAMEAFAIVGDSSRRRRGKITRDDNLFRVSKDLDPVGDTYRTTSLGFNLDAPVSRQRFQGGYTGPPPDTMNSRSQLRRPDARATWLCSSATMQAASWDIRIPLRWRHLIHSKQDSRPLRTRQLSSMPLSGNAALGGSSGVRGSDRQTAIRSVRSSTSTLALRRQRELCNSGQYLGGSQRPDRGGQFSESWTFGRQCLPQDGVGIVADWTPRSVALERTRRSRQATLFPGAATGLRWHIARASTTGTTASFTGCGCAAGHYPYQDINSSFVLVKGVTLRPALSLTEKSGRRGPSITLSESFLPSPGQTSGATPRRTDRVRSATATVSYRPHGSLPC